MGFDFIQLSFKKGLKKEIYDSVLINKPVCSIILRNASKFVIDKRVC